MASLFKRALKDEFAGFVDIFVSSDGTSIPAGANFLNRVEKGLLNCMASVYLISPTSINRNWINFELGAVWIRNIDSVRGGGSEIPTIPVCHSGCMPGNLRMPLNTLNAILGSDPLQIERAFRSIQSAVGGTGALRTDFTNLASGVAGLEQNGSIQERQAQALPTLSSAIRPSPSNPTRYYSSADKDRIAETFHRLRGILLDEANPLQLQVQNICQAWNQRQTRKDTNRSLNLRQTIDQIYSARNDASRIGNDIFATMMNNNPSYETLLKIVLDYRIPDPFRNFREHADRIRDALTSADAIYRELPHQSERIVEIVVRILEPFSETNARLNGWIHSTLRRIKEQEELVLTRE